MFDKSLERGGHIPVIRVDYRTELASREGNSTIVGDVLSGIRLPLVPNIETRARPPPTLDGRGGPILRAVVNHKPFEVAVGLGAKAVEDTCKRMAAVVVRVRTVTFGVRRVESSLPRAGSPFAVEWRARTIVQDG